MLHFIAAEWVADSFPIRHMLNKHKERTEDRDNARRRPLTVVIKVKHELFIKTALESKYDELDLERILGLKSSWVTVYTLLSSKASTRASQSLLSVKTLTTC